MALRVSRVEVIPPRIKNLLLKIRLGDRPPLTDSLPQAPFLEKLRSLLAPRKRSPDQILHMEKRGSGEPRRLAVRARTTLGLFTAFMAILFFVTVKLQFEHMKRRGLDRFGLLHALPRGIVESTSDMVLKPLWRDSHLKGNRGNYTTLLAMPVGIKQKKNVDRMVRKPALDPDQSEIHHRITIRNKTGKVHRWVEGMAPVFSRAAWRCVWHLIQVLENDLIHGWGLDMKLGYCAQALPSMLVLDVKIESAATEWGSALPLQIMHAAHVSYNCHQFGDALSKSSYLFCRSERVDKNIEERGKILSRG
ncbi:hypothetical protein ACLOJK_014280 [Asimina triloba]